MGSSTKASFTPFVDPRVYQTSPTDEDEEEDESTAAGKLEGPDVLAIAWLSFLLSPDFKKVIIGLVVKPFIP